MSKFISKEIFPISVSNLFTDQKDLFQKFNQQLYEKSLSPFFQSDLKEFFILQKREGGLYFAAYFLSSSQISSTNILENANYDLLAGYLSKEDIYNPKIISNFHGLRVKGNVNQTYASMNHRNETSYFFEDLFFSYKNFKDLKNSVGIQYSGLTPYIDGKLSMGMEDIECRHNLEEMINFSPKIVELMTQGILNILPLSSTEILSKEEFTECLSKNIPSLTKNSDFQTILENTLTPIEFQSELMSILKNIHFPSK